MKMSQSIGLVHFIGIGGIGMSGIAEIMLKIGYSVQGSDAKSSANTERLEKLGARIFIGHDAAHVSEGVSAVVYSTAVQPTNPEMVEARARRMASLMERIEGARAVMKAPVPRPVAAPAKPAETFAPVRQAMAANHAAQQSLNRARRSLDEDLFAA